VERNRRWMLATKEEEYAAAAAKYAVSRRAVMDIERRLAEKREEMKALNVLRADLLKERVEAHAAERKAFEELAKLGDNEAPLK
jgi:hypothetical protein